MRTVRKIVRDRIGELGLTTYAVAKLVEGKMTKQTVYNFVNGRRDIKSDSLDHLLDALGLRIVADRDTKPDSKTARANVSRRKRT